MSGYRNVDEEIALIVSLVAYPFELKEKSIIVESKRSKYWHFLSSLLKRSCIMARLSYSLIRAARAEHPYLPLLLQACRDLATARDELRQLCEYVADRQKKTQNQAHGEGRQAQFKHHPISRRRRLAARNWVKTPCLLDLCRKRALGKPLPYIRGSQPFGNLEILCEKHVLIPRQTTANYTSRIAELLTRHLSEVKAHFASDKTAFSVLDLCTGSGCIPLLLHALLAPHFPNLRIIGMELSENALKNAKKNLAWNVRLGNLEARAATEVTFIQFNILDSFPTELGEFDLVISNPPYATPQEYHSSAISKSVRCYEPLEALVPDENHNHESVSGHAYFTAIDSIAQGTHAKVVMIEMGLEEQFAHVCRELQTSTYWEKVEVWRDQVYSSLLGREPNRERVLLKDVRGIEVPANNLGIGWHRVVVGINEEWRWLNE